MNLAAETGAQLEDAAIEYLQNAGILLLHRNFRCAYGEIDLIAQDQTSLVFIEVRFRKNNHFGSAAETVTHAKQQKIIRATEFFLQTRSWAAKLACRFDVIAITNTLDMPHIEWIKDAFHA